MLYSLYLRTNDMSVVTSFQNILTLSLFLSSYNKIVNGFISVWVLCLFLCFPPISLIRWPTLIDNETFHCIKWNILDLFMPVFDVSTLSLLETYLISCSLVASNGGLAIVNIMLHWLMNIRTDWIGPGEAATFPASVGRISPYHHGLTTKLASANTRLTLAEDADRLTDVTHCVSKMCYQQILTHLQNPSNK